jgi:hypothetical protein
MLATFAFDVCHDVYRAAREVIDTKIPTLNMESSGKYMWHPDRMPRLAEYVADFARAGERALGEVGQTLLSVRSDASGAQNNSSGRCLSMHGRASDRIGQARVPVLPGRARTSPSQIQHRINPSQLRASRMVMFRVFYLGGAEYQAARRHLGISELTWADWAEEIRTRVGRELTRAGVFPPSKYFRASSIPAPENAA